jgi:threonine/homoserine/homoserine lactone efflux protein
VPDLATLAVFSLAALGLLVVPGPAVIYIVTQSVSHGRVAGLVSVLGIEVGGLVHVAAAALGLSALLASSTVAFDAVKYAGAAYLVYLGVRRLLGFDLSTTIEEPGSGHRARLFRQGVVVNVLNPKTALFFFAFLPQFVYPDRGSAAIQALVLGLLFILLAIVSDGIYALAAGTARVWLLRSRTYARAQRYVSGAVFVGLGVGAALSGARK